MGENLEIISKNYLSLFTVFGGFAPNSQTAEVLSKALGSRTVMSGSISRGKNDPSQSLQMMERPLLTPDELKSIPKGHFVVMKTGSHPMKARLHLFLDWGIRFGKPYITAEKSQRKVYYADKKILEENIEKSLGLLKTENLTIGEKIVNKSNTTQEKCHEKPKKKPQPNGFDFKVE